MKSEVDIDDTPEARAANAEHCRKLDAAANAPGFAGELRLAIRAAKIPSHRLAQSIGVTVYELEAFRAGEAVLSSDAIEQLVDFLNLHLVSAQ